MKKGAYINEVILKTLLVGGVMTMSLIAPNVLQSLKLFKRKRSYSPSYITQKIKILEKEGYVKLAKKSNSIFIQITPLGKIRLKQHQVKNGVLDKTKWDKKWRLIIFDIKEYRSNTRSKLRRELANFGFKKLQNSVWISPYKCEDFITLLKADLKIGKDLLYLEVSKIENEQKIKNMFNL